MKVGESVKVIASFDRKKVEIHYFGWQNRVYKVDGLNFFHIAKDNKRQHYCFSVTADGNSYLLSFDPQTLVWQIEATENE